MATPTVTISLDRPDQAELEDMQDPEASIGQDSGSTEVSIKPTILDNNDKMASSVPVDSSTSDRSKAILEVSVPNVTVEHSAGYPSNIYHPQPQQVYYAGFESPTTEWEDFRHYVNLEGLDLGSPVVYNEDPTLIYHTGFGYSSQMPYGQFSPVSTPMPPASGDGPMYSAQHYSFSSPYYQPHTPHGLSYMNSPAGMAHGDHMMPVDPVQGSFLADSMNTSMLFGPHPDWSRSSDMSVTGNQLLQPHAPSQQPLGVSGSFGPSSFPLSSGMASQNSRSFYGFGSSNSSYGKGYSSAGIFPHFSNYGGSLTSFGLTNKGSLSVHKHWGHGRGSALVCSCNGSLDFLNEQNRGPRATRPKKQSGEQNSTDGFEINKLLPGVDRTLYNTPDFDTEYEDGKFFIIKSYSEDNVHKSIKYGVWASTANGNRKLDSAYHEAKAKGTRCPIFLLFSVNASAQFCGVAEMIGPVDFEKSVNYWQQDKWTGQFPVKWHIVKDVPNNLFRHIILENNENKPVTNSRDTQEVKLVQGLEMLKIFKNHEDDISILDDFGFYEDREKALQENKARQKQLLLNSAAVEPQKPIHIPVDIMNQITKNFAQAVRLQDANSLKPSERSGAGDSPVISAKPEEFTESTESR